MSSRSRAPNLAARLDIGQSGPLRKYVSLRESFETGRGRLDRAKKETRKRRAARSKLAKELRATQEQGARATEMTDLSTTPTGNPALTYDGSFSAASTFLLGVRGVIYVSPLRTDSFRLELGSPEGEPGYAERMGCGAGLK